MKAKKSLGQNFLKNDTIIKQIVSLFVCDENDLIIEIGPGTGALTRYLRSLPAKLICIEIDLDMRPYLENLGVDVIYENVLLTNLSELIKKYNYKNLYIVGNLPYYITSPIIEKVISSNLNAQKMVFMVQKEVAQRFSAKEGTSAYGYMSVYINHYYNANMQFIVPKEDFDPMPKVDSAIITLDKKEVIPIENEDLFFAFIKQAFSLKRKTLKNNLKMYDQKIINNVLENYNLPLSARAEQLNEKVLIELYQKLSG